MNSSVRSRWVWPLCIVLGVVLFSGCAGSTPNPFEEGVGSPQGREITVWVRSANRNAVEVTLLGSGGRRVALGIVEGRRSETFTVQWNGGIIRARIEMVAGRRFTTQPVLLTTQVSIVIDVGVTLNRSSIRAN